MYLSEYNVASPATWDLWNYDGTPTTSTPVSITSQRTSSWPVAGVWSGFDSSGIGLRDRRLNNRIVGDPTDPQDVNHYNSGYCPMVLWDERTVISCAHFAETVTSQFSSVSFRNSSGSLFSYDLDWASREEQSSATGDLVAVPFATSADDADSSLKRYGSRFFVPHDADFWAKKDYGTGIPILLVDSQGKAARLWVIADTYAGTFTAYSEQLWSCADDGVGSEIIRIGEGDSGSPYFMYHGTHGWLYAGMYGSGTSCSPGWVDPTGTDSFYGPLNALGATIGTATDISEAQTVVELDTTSATFSPPTSLINKKLKASVSATNSAGSSAYFDTPYVVPTVSGAFGPYFADPDGLEADSSFFDGNAYVGKTFRLIANITVGSPSPSYIEFTWKIDGVVIPNEIGSVVANPDSEGKQQLNMVNVVPATATAGQELSCEATIYNIAGADTATYKTTLKDWVAASVTSLSVTPSSPQEEQSATLSYTTAGDPAPVVTINYQFGSNAPVVDQPATMTIPDGTAGTDAYKAYVTFTQAGAAAPGAADVYPFQADIVE